MSDNLRNNEIDDRTSDEKFFGLKMWDIYANAHSDDDDAHEAGFEIETETNRCHRYKEIATLRVTHVPKYHKDAFQHFVRDAATHHNRGPVKTCLLFDRNNRGDPSANDTVVFVTFKYAVDNLWFIVNYDNLLYPPNEYGLRIAVKPNGFSNNSINEDYISADFRPQLFGVKRFVSRHYPRRIKGNLVFIDDDSNDPDVEIAREASPDIVVRRALFTNHYHRDRERNQREFEARFARQPNDTILINQPTRNQNENVLDALNNSFSSQSINGEPNVATSSPIQPPAPQSSQTTSQRCDAAVQTTSSNSIQVAALVSGLPLSQDPHNQPIPQPHTQPQQPQTLIERFLSLAPASLRNFKIPRLRLDYD
jgi:hypothetical protein